MTVVGRSRGTSQGRAAAVVAASLALLPAGAAGDAPGAATPGVLTAADIGARLRVFATAGDYKLQNASVTAVIRRSDGWLTELWRNRPVLPTTDQLGTLTEIDGIWQVHPIVKAGSIEHPIKASRVALLADGIEVEGSVEVNGRRVRAVTVHRLDASAPRLRMTTTFEVEGGAKLGGLAFGDAVKWGNTTYYVEGLGKPRMKHSGYAAWIGRRGAGGDLMLRPLSSEKLHVEFTAKVEGFQGPISVIYKKGTLPASGGLVVERELAYQPLPLPTASRAEPTGTVTLSITDERGRPLPAKVRVQRPGRADPIFEATGGLDGADHFLWTGNGEATRALPPGRYQLLITAGIERAASRHAVEITAGQTTQVQAQLPRVLDTPGWIGADLHLHQAPSVDADLSLPARVVSVAAEGVELAVATDHYVVTDLAPTVRWLRERGVLTAELATVAGSEVSTLGHRFGHFNVFPLDPAKNVKSLDTTPAELFADARRQSPGGVLQVNHPRWESNLGYFTAYGLDEKTAVPARPGYDPSFDALEVYNGDDAYNVKAVRKVMVDWMRLLGQGRRYVATGSSDSHNLAFLDPGMPRTMIRHGAGSSDEHDVQAAPQAVLAALKAGHAIVTSGPMIEASVAGAGPGDTARGVGKRASVQVTVRAAPWIDVRTVEVWDGGRAQRVHFAPVPRSSKILRLDRTFDVPITSKTFVIVTAQGERAVPNASREMLPFAFTNPIWIEP